MASPLASTITGRHHKQTQLTAVCMLHSAIVLHTDEALYWKDRTGSGIITVRVYLFLVHNVFSRVGILSLWNFPQFQSNILQYFIHRFYRSHRPRENPAVSLCLSPHPRVVHLVISYDGTFGSSISTTVLRILI